MAGGSLVQQGNFWFQIVGKNGPTDRFEWKAASKSISLLPNDLAKICMTTVPGSEVKLARFDREDPDRLLRSFGLTNRYDAII